MLNIYCHKFDKKLLLIDSQHNPEENQLTRVRQKFVHTKVNQEGIGLCLHTHCPEFTNYENGVQITLNSLGPGQ